MKLHLITGVFFCGMIAFSTEAQIQCTVDVQILEGENIEMCANAPTTISGLAGFVSYDWTGPEVLAGQSVTPSFSGEYILSALDGVGCISLDTIDVIINPAPTDAILSSEGNPICSGVGTTLSLSGAYVSYLWDGGITTPTIQTSIAGTYNVGFIDNNGCAGLASIDLTLPAFALTSSGASVCTGGATTLNASGGDSYSWSTGETANSIIVSPSETTVYTVIITLGTCSETFSYTVVPGELPEFELPEVIYLGVLEPFYIAGPPDYESYSWYPTDQISNSTDQGVTFYGTETQYMTVEATHADGCVFVDNVLVVIVDLTIPSGFSPNGDGINDKFYIPELDELGASVAIWNRWGDMVLDVDGYENNWQGTCETDACLGNGDVQDGTYFYRVDAFGITFQGYLTLKR